ncbi:RagB/SusD family nutrient uptake outer membrane protein [termite gut metagenome]|uniref:RagB/SusD family nutrient uptake outer membrane protein n=1 Tax=termite gut metagenome TaxID=433724 RepID=A0A5J4RNJ9_9ZZZZ
MKKIYQSIIGIYFVLAVISLSSCEDFLDVKPTSSIVADNAITDARTARASIIGVYASLKSYCTGSELTLGVMPADNVSFGGSQSQNIDLDNNAFTVTNSAIVGAYRSLYSLINRANWVIASLDNVTDPLFTSEEKDQILGEAYFIRAFGYFNLGRSWGGVQIQLTPTTDLSVLNGIRRSTLAETYAQVKADLTEAERLLPENNTTRNRAQKSIARALRARLHLYAGEWAEAETYASQVIANPKYELVYPYQAFFTSPFLTKESVFEITFSTNDRNSTWSSWYPSSVVRSGSYQFVPTNEIAEKLTNPEIAGSRSALIKNDPRVGYYGVLYNTAVASASVVQSTDPAYVIRIAELYLIRAEARAKKVSADLSGAIADLNAIRQRADLAPFPSTSNAQAVILAIEEERRIEFAFEAHRWYDLVRTERVKEVLGVEKNYWLFPIPQADILSDPDIEQNPGY